MAKCSKSSKIQLGPTL